LGRNELSNPLIAVCIDLHQILTRLARQPAIALISGQTCYPLDEELTMAETTKLSVEKALNKVREADARKTKATQREEQIELLDEEIKRMRAQRLRLEGHQRRSTKRG